MKFTVSSATLLNRVQTIGKVVVSGKNNSMAILDNILLEIKDNKLTLVGSDLETTVSTTMDIDGADGELVIALPARRLTDSLKEFADQPLTFHINPSNLAVEIVTETGKFNLIAQNGNDFPEKPSLNDSQKHFTIEPTILNNGIAKTIFATSNDENRPNMTGINFKFTPGKITFAATDAHKLVRLSNQIECGFEDSFILPKKSANLVKSLLTGHSENQINVSFDDKNIVFNLDEHQVICRRIEGKYPNYEAVIPQNNPYEITIDRLLFANALRRVAAFANKSTYLVKINISTGNIQLSAQDIDFSVSANEQIACQYEGDSIKIGFPAIALIDILNSISGDEVRMQLADPSRAGLILPLENVEGEDLLMLLMPMIINE